MQKWIKNIEAWFLEGYWPLDIALVALAVLVLFSIATYWWTNTSGPLNSIEQIGVSFRWAKAFNYALMLIFPLATLLGTLLLIFPIGQPKALYVDSQSRSTQQWNSPKDRSAYQAWKAEWKTSVNAEEIELQTYTNRVLEILVSQNVSNSWDRDDYKTGVRIAEAVESVISLGYEHKLQHSYDVKSLPRWLIETSEIALIKGLLLSQNIRHLHVEAYPRITASGHSWLGLEQYFKKNIQHVEKLSGGDHFVHLADTPQLDDSPTIVGSPIIIRSNGDINAEVLSKIFWPNDQSQAIISIIDSSGNIIGSSKSVEPRLLAPTAELVSLSVPSALVNERAFLALNNPETGQITQHRLNILTNNRYIDIEFKGSNSLKEKFERTIDTLKNCTNEEVTQWKVDNAELARIRATGNRGVVVEWDNEINSLWIYSSKANFSGKSELRKKLNKIPDSIEEKNRFIKATVARQGRPSMNSFNLTTLRQVPSQKFLLPEAGVVPLVYTSAHRPPAADPVGMKSEGIYPLLSRFTLKKKNTTENYASQNSYAFLYSIDPSEQGMFLDSNCTGDKNFDSARFFAFWSSLLTAIAQADNTVLMTSANVDKSTIYDPLFVLDGRRQNRIAATKMLPGLILLTIGLAGYVLLAVWGKFAAKI